MAASITCDLASFRAGLRRRVNAVKRAAANVMNDVGARIIESAIEFTAEASEGDIEDALLDNGLLFRLLQSPTFQRRLPPDLRGLTRGTSKRAQIQAAARQLLRRRVASRGYIRAGWHPALNTLRSGSSQPIRRKSLAGRGKATRATPGNLKVTATNSARGASKIGQSALRQAIRKESPGAKRDAMKAMAAAWR